MKIKLTKMYVYCGLEQKIEFICNKYFKQLNTLNLSKENLIEIVRKADPTSNSMYLEWIVLNVIRNNIIPNEDEEKVREALEDFERLKKNRLVKDVNIYNYVPSDLYRLSSDNRLVLNEIKGKQTFKEEKKQQQETDTNYNEIYNDGTFQIIKVSNIATAQNLAQDTNWCVKNESSAKSYLASDPLYFILKNDEKYALLHVESSQLKDINDKELEIEYRKELQPIFVNNNIIPNFLYEFFIMENKDYQLSQEEQDYIDTSKNPKIVAFHAVNYLKQKVSPEKENIIAKNPESSYDYLKNILVPNGIEAPNNIINSIAKSTMWSYYYARDVLKSPFPAGEPAIAKDALYSYQYAIFLKKPFRAGEPAIAQSAKYSYYYARSILNYKPFPAGEPAIAQSASYSCYYAKDVLKGPFQAGEPAIAKDAEYSYAYAKRVLKGPFPAGEPAIAQSAEWSYYYARDVLKGPFPAGEPAILNSVYRNDYIDLLKEKNIFIEEDQQQVNSKTKFINLFKLSEIEKNKIINQWI